MAGVNFKGKGLNQTLFSKKAVRATAGKRSSAFKAIMENKAVASVMDKRGEKSAFYDALKKRGQAAGKKGITKNVLKKVLGDIEHSGEFSHKEMHVLGEELIGGAAASRIVRDHSVDHSEGHERGNVRRRNFDEVLEKQHSRHYEKIQSGVESPAQASARRLMLTPNKNIENASRQMQGNRIGEILSEDKVRRFDHFHPNEDLEAQDGVVSSALERIKKLATATASSEESIRQEGNSKIREMLSKDITKKLDFVHSGTEEEKQVEVVPLKEEEEKKNTLIEETQKRKLTLNEILNRNVTERLKSVGRQSKKENQVESGNETNDETSKDEKNKQTRSESNVPTSNSSFLQNNSQAFGYIAKHLKSFNKVVDYDKIKSIIAKIAEDEEDDEEEKNGSKFTS